MNGQGNRYTVIRPSSLELQYPIRGHGALTLRIELDQPFAPAMWEHLAKIMADIEILTEHWPLMGETEEGVPVIWEIDEQAARREGHDAMDWSGACPIVWKARHD